MHKDAARYTKKCDQCQRTGRPTKSDEMTSLSLVVVTPYDKWGIDIVGPIEPSSNGKSYIVVCTNYVAKWVEAKPIKHARDNNGIDNLY